MNVSSKVPPAFNGASVLDYLTGRFTYLPEATWLQLLAQGRICCRGSVCAGTERVATGDDIRCALPEFEAPPVNFDYAMVYQDAWLLAINKPAGLRVHSGGKFVTANLIYHLRHLHQPPFPEADLIHRLDADTSGLVLLARDKAVLGQLMGQFADGSVDKRYLAVVAGRPQPAAGTIDLPLGPVPGAAVPRFGVDRTGGKPALTHYQTVRPLGPDFTLVQLHPETGRTHQLRVHLAALGHPIAGDALYTMTDAAYLRHCRNPSPSPSLLQRQALHCHQLRFFHPVLHSTCSLTAPLAPDMEQFMGRVAAVDRNSEEAPAW